jgi:hypothetical protein
MPGLVAGIAGCTGLQSAGSVSETTNGVVTGALVDQTGTPARNAKVLLLPAGYDPVKDSMDIAADTTDSLGRYSFVQVRPGEYAVFATHNDNGTNVRITGIVARDIDDTVATGTLRMSGAVRVAISTVIGAENGYVYIPGTPLFRFIANGTDFVTLDGVPAGKVEMLAFSTIATQEFSVIRYDMHIVSQDTTTVWNTMYRFSRKLFLNTSASGADVAGGVSDFPVLVRLNDKNFNFSQAGTDGSDIRFARSDSSFLPSEIVRWDPVAELAEVWVNVDTVRGGDSTQSITLYWGNPDASATKNRTAVFDTVHGFAGVWHLGETSGTVADDASPNGLAGEFRGGLPNYGRGPSGNCQNIMQRDSDYIDMGDAIDPGVNDISVGIWIKRASFGTPQALAGKTNGGYPSATYGFLLSIDPGNFPHFNIATGGAAWGDEGTFEVAGNKAIVDSTAWHQVFVVIDRTGNNYCRFYVDGVDCTGNRGGDISRLSEVANALRFRIGTENDNNASFKGSISEATVAFTVRSADWVKLCYMNQREQDALVHW